MSQALSEALRQFHFLQPQWLLGLLALPLLLVLAVRRSPAQQALSRLVDAELLPHLLQGRANRRHVPLTLIALSGCLCLLALAGPTWSRSAQPLYANRAAQVVALSLSQQMLARDITPSRLDRARYKVRDLFAANHDGLNALIAYADEAFVVAPLTTDANSLSDLLSALAPDTMPVDGNNAAQAIDRGVALIRNAKVGGGSIILITDQAGTAAQAAASKARAAGIDVSVLGVGTPQGGAVPLGDGGFLRNAEGGLEMAKRDDAALAALAGAGGGRYVAMSDDRRDVDTLHAQLRVEHAPTLASGQQGDAWQDRGPWLLLPLLPLAALAFRRGWLLLLPLLLLPLLPNQAYASSWTDLWQRPDQQAARALHDGKSQQAQQLARDPALRGAAAYRAGDYAAAASALKQASGADAQYNLGNALAKQGQYTQALAAYDQALKSDPADADAKTNRQAVADWLRKQQEQQKQDQQKQGKSEPKPSSGENKGASSASKPGTDSSESKSGQQQNSSQDGQGQASSAADQSTQGKDSKQSQTLEGDAGAKSRTAQEQAEQQARAEQARQALQKQMDQKLAEQDKKAPENAPGVGVRGAPKPGERPVSHELGAVATDDPQAKLPADVRRAMQRVPDDPGALLRRKFVLEYRQRHAAATGDEQP
ncbi:VWA domain-containing protein [Dyella tabacisoli]|uniref:VWA domain-containing protein n=1 Tax=Dyella tabacisoli TaxID=2282381 RepID=A0A369UMV8_9GAMM|nr:VWA domain-containing protein [Dyella tabacisoli]RDD81946.1 VWA domain-containing protein [Dyella tabacisoli]